MTRPKPSITVNVDVTNPGHFFACCGLLELADRLWPGAEGWFTDTQFHVTVDSVCDKNPLKKIIDAVTNCHSEIIYDERTKAKEASIRVGTPVNMKLDWWLNADQSANSQFKTWAANASSSQMFCKWQIPLKKLTNQILENPKNLFEKSIKKQGSYGFDSRMGWEAINIGFSLNNHNFLKKLPLRPAVELFGALGLQRFFPEKNLDNTGILYYVWQHSLPVIVAACAAKGHLNSKISYRHNSRFVRRGSFKGFDYSNPPTQTDNHI